MTQHSDGASPWNLIPNVSPQQKDAARHTIAGLAADVDDAALLMRACGLIEDPLADRFHDTPVGTVNGGPNAKYVTPTT